MNKKLFAPILSIAAFAAVSIGATYALFTDKKEAKVDITAGKVKVAMTSTIDFARSRYEDVPPFDAVENAEGTEFDAVYENGNTAKIASSTTGLAVTLDRMTPMDDISLKVNFENNSNVNIKWRMGIELKGELIPALLVKYDNVDYSSTVDTVAYTPWSDVVEKEVTKLVDEKPLYVAFPDHDAIDPEFDNNFQNKEGHIRIFIEAVQGNAEVDDSCVVTTKDELMSYVSGWNAGTEHRPLRLGANIDVSDQVWTPLGNWKNPYFGEIKGKNFTITGIGQGGFDPVFTEDGEYAAGFIGIAGANEDGKELTISNLKLTNAKINLPDTGSNIGILMGYAPVTSDFNSKGSAVGAGNKQVSALTVKNVSVDGTVSGLKTCGGLIGKVYSTGQVEVANCNINADVTTVKNHIAEIIGYVNGTSVLNVHDNMLSGSLHAPINEFRMDDEVVIKTFLDTYLIDSNTSNVKLYYDNTEISDPIKITNEFNDDGSVKSINYVWDGKDLGKNLMDAAHGTDKLRITLKNSAANNNQQIMTNQATDDVIVTLDSFSTTANVSVANLVLKGDCNIVNSYTTAKKTLDIESGTYKNVTADSNCVAVMNGGKVTKLNVNDTATLYLNGGSGEEVYLHPGSTLTTGASLSVGTEDNYTFKVTIGDNIGKGKVTTVNGVPYTTHTMYLYFLVA